MATLHCPICNEELERLRCPNPECGFNEQYDLRATGDGGVARVAAGLNNSGNAYIDRETDTLYILTDYTRYVYNTVRPSAQDLEGLAAVIRSEFALSLKAFSTRSARELLMHFNKHDILPKIEASGTYPLLVANDDGKLVFPFNGSARSRYYRNYYYNGPPLTPQMHGGVFDRWIQSFRCKTDNDYEVLRTWVLSLFLQLEVNWGRYPALLLVAAEGSNVGKTESAVMLSRILGPLLPIYWKNDKMPDLDRCLIEGDNRFLLIDNLVAGSSGVIEDGRMSEYLTKSMLNTKRLYGGGSVKVPKTNVDILTANSPILAPDLLERVLCVGLSAARPKDARWLDRWGELRNSILEEGMAIVIKNSKKRVDAKPDDDFRHSQWYTQAAMAVGKAPVIYPADAPVGSPVDLILDRAMPEDQTRVSMEDAVEVLSTSPRRIARSFRDQVGTVTEKIVRKFITRWSKTYEIIEESEDTWITKK
jgi:hypothetical protein